MKLFTGTYRQEMENAKQVKKQVLSKNELIQVKGGVDAGGIVQ